MPGLGLTRYLGSRFCDAVGLRTRLQGRIWAEHEKAYVVDPLMLEVLDLQLVACVHVAADRFWAPRVLRVSIRRDHLGQLIAKCPGNAFLWCSSPLSNRIRPHNPRTSGPKPWRAFRTCRGRRSFQVSEFLRR